MKNFTLNKYLFYNNVTASIPPELRNLSNIKSLY